MTTDLLARRAALLGPNVPTFYDDPVHLVRGEGVWLWDADGRKYLDCYNNVAHVGHCHPHVVEAIARQSATLNTHTRYLHEGIIDYGTRLCATFSNDLSQLIMACTGSEANDIALRMAQAVTGKTGIIATDNTYHGNTTATANLSTRRPPIGGYPSHIRLVPAPDSTREGGVDGDLFASHVARAIRQLEDTGHGFAGFMLCPIFANEGFPAVAPGFLDATAAVIKKAGGLILCDEVQPGFGRIGSHWWGHDWLGLVPDVVTLGKPMANGYPVAATVTRPDIMAAFRGAFGYFNTYGGNPVACAAAMATLDVIEDENLIAHAARVGDICLGRMTAMSHPLKVEARGRGLFFGIEFAYDDGAPASDFTARLVEEMRMRGVLLGRIGRDMNILKMRPPLSFSAQNAVFALDILEDVLAQADPHDR